MALKLRQLEAIDSSSASFAQSRPQSCGSAWRCFPPVLFVVWSNLSPGRAFLQEPGNASVSAF
jgi:hypothetical protein